MGRQIIGLPRFQITFASFVANKDQTYYATLSKDFKMASILLENAIQTAGAPFAKHAQ